MKKSISYVFLAACSVVAFTQCSEKSAIEPVVITPITPTDPVAIANTVSFPMKDSYYQLLAYPKGTIVNFTLDGAKKVDYEARAYRSKPYDTHDYIDGKSTIIKAEEISSAILPNKDSLLCMMVEMNTYTQTFFVMVEDNRNNKWNYFNFKFDDKGKILTDNSAYKVSLLPTFTYNKKTYKNVYYNKNSGGDELWYLPIEGVINVALSDGRTFERN
ncbi:MAG: hypothetical protein RLZZ292_1061 [Bacteroidota bacterium]|jgi:hypothetical protein